MYRITFDSQFYTYMEFYGILMETTNYFHVEKIFIQTQKIIDSNTILLT